MENDMMNDIIEILRDFRVINALAKFENDSGKIVDLGALIGASLPSHPLDSSAALSSARAMTISQSTERLLGINQNTKDSHYVPFLW